jgi:hypothetical protein
MITSIKWVMPFIAVAFPLTAFAQSGDAAYCRALAEKYEAFLVNMNGHSQQEGSLDGSVAVAQCREGNPTAAIPVLEQKLNEAKIPLPRRS